MERLTGKDKDGTAMCPIKDCEEDACSWFCHHEEDVWNKLAEYEDLEEQGLINKLPCKAGETVYCIEECGDDFEISGYVFLAVCGEYYLVTAHYASCHTFEDQLEDMLQECVDSGCTDVNMFHKTRVFTTHEEAKKALAEMEK